MKTADRRILNKFKRNLARRLDKTQPTKTRGETPVFAGSNLKYEMSGRVHGVACGGVAAIHEMVRASGLIGKINESVRLLKVHLPYFESDHILALAYNILNGGTCIEDLERCREDENFMNALGAERIPDPTTSGDFLRRFSEEAVELLMDLVNEIRVVMWQELLSREERKVAYVDVDGTITGTNGETKQGMDISYKGVWGYAPLVVSLSNTKEPLYIVNRPGNVPSAQGAAKYIDKALGYLLQVFDTVVLRGDTDFSQTKYLDDWNATGRVLFTLGYDCRENLVTIAGSLPRKAWNRLGRPKRYEVKTRERTKPENVKERIVEQRGYRNIRLIREDVAEFEYQPLACKQSYRMVVVRKTVDVLEGQTSLLEETRCFFYITNDPKPSAAEVVFQANDRCDQENLISQLKSQVCALSPCTATLVSNWAWMAISSLAWTFKSWYALMIANKAERQAALRMEFKRFRHLFISIPCQVVRRARQTVLRIVNYHASLPTFFATFDAILALRALRL